MGYMNGAMDAVARAAVALRAMLNGSASEVFSVATATAGSHAMRYEQYRTRQLLVDAATGTGSPANTAENVLKTCTVPAGLLATNGDQIHFVGCYRFAANATTKKLRIYFGTTNIMGTGDFAVATALNVVIEGWIIRTGATSQVAYIKVHGGADAAVLQTGTPYQMVEFNSAAEILANALPLQTRVVLGAGAALNDVIQDTFYYEHVRV